MIPHTKANESTKDGCTMYEGWIDVRRMDVRCTKDLTTNNRTLTAKRTLLNKSYIVHQ